MGDALLPHLVDRHGISPDVVYESPVVDNLERHKQLHFQDDAHEMRHIHLEGQQIKDCWICSGPKAVRT